jgi:hypothetical protein
MKNLDRVTRITYLIYFSGLRSKVCPRVHVSMKEQIVVILWHWFVDKKMPSDRVRLNYA